MLKKHFLIFVIILFPVIVQAQVPGMPFNPDPFDLESDVPTNYTLWWEFGADTETYDLYFDLLPTPITLVDSDFAGATGTWDPGVLLENTTYYWQVVAHNSFKASTPGPIWSFTTGTSTAPGLPHNPSPADFAVDQSLTTIVTWDFGANTDNYDVFFDDFYPPTTFRETGLAGASGSYDPGTLTENTTYYWQVICFNATKGDTPGPTWSFTTVSGGGPPGSPSNPWPQDSATDVPALEILMWDWGNDTSTYEIYMDTFSPPTTLADSGQAGVFGEYIPPPMDFLTTYYWQVVAINSNKASTSGPIWSFTTGEFVGIGSGTEIDKHIPMEPSDGFTYSQTLYLKNEINISNSRIDRIFYHYNGNSAWSQSVDLYLGHTSLTTLSDWVPYASLNQVFSGTFSVPATDGWVEIVFDTPFLYNNVDNLIVAFDDNTSSYSDALDEFYCTLSPTKGVRSIYYSANGSNPDPSNPPNSSKKNGKGATFSSFYPNIRFQFDDIPSGAVLDTFPGSWDFGDVGLEEPALYDFFDVWNVGDTAASIIGVAITGAGAANFTLDDPNSYPFSLTPGNVLSVDVAFTPAAEGLQQAYLTITDSTKGTTDIPISGTGVDTYLGAFPIYEYFEDVFPPTGWTISGTHDWGLYDDPVFGDKFAFCFLSEWGSGSGTLRSPKFDFQTVRRGVIQFTWSHKYDSNFPNDRLEVVVTDGSTWSRPIFDRSGKDFDSKDGATDLVPGAFAEYYVVIPEEAMGKDTVYIEFRATSGGGPNLFLNDLYIDRLPEVVINEVAWAGTEADPTHEWIELYNPTDNPIDIASWSLYGATASEPTFFSGPGINGSTTTIVPPKGYLIYGTSPNIFSSGATVHIWDSDLDLSDILQTELELYAGVDNTFPLVDLTPAAVWCGGDNITMKTMERVDHWTQGVQCLNWTSHDGTTVIADDSDSLPVYGTPGKDNSTLMRLQITRNGDDVVVNWPATYGLDTYSVLSTSSFPGILGLDFMAFPPVTTPFHHVGAAADSNLYFYIIRPY